jgi:hypothetical protein
VFPESDDSENEGGMGNVSRVIMRPPGHSGKAKRGHLCFDASFESGESRAKKTGPVKDRQRFIVLFNLINGAFLF